MIIAIILFAIAVLCLVGCKKPTPNPNPNPDPEPDPQPNPEDGWIAYYPIGYTIPKIDIHKLMWRDRKENELEQVDNVLIHFANENNRTDIDDLTLSLVLFTKVAGEYYFQWTSDMQTWLLLDYWATPYQFVITKEGKGDCLEENTEIMVKDDIKKIKDLQIGDLVLSYNYDLERYEYKPVTKLWDKGNLDGYDIKLKNGHNIIATGEHRFFCRTSEDYPKKYEIKKFKDIDLDSWSKHQLHCVYRLPEGSVDINKNWAYLCGIYIAEGYSEKSHVCIAQDKPEIRVKIEQALNILHIPYTKSKRTKHAYYNILNSYYKDKLKELGNNSFNKKFPEDVLNWNNKSLKYLIEGLLDGDGCDCTNYKDNFADNLNHNALWEFSTSSEQVAKIFNLIVRKVYGNIHYYKQNNHQGVGKQPIWRLRFNPQGLSNKREIFNGISCVSIAKSKVKEIKGKHYYDVEVQDNHNFILADSGVISHNCDDFAGLHCYYLHDLCNYYLTWWIEVYWQRKVTANGVDSWKSLGHAITIYKRSPESNWRCFSNQSLLGRTNGFETLEEIIRKFCPNDDDHRLIKVAARHPMTGKLLWERKG